VFIGDRGMLLGNGKLLPEDKFKDFQTPPETLPRSPVTGSSGSTTPRALVPCRVRTSSTRVGRRSKHSQRGIPDREEDRVDYGNLRAGTRGAAPFIKRPQYRKGWTTS